LIIERLLNSENDARFIAAGNTCYGPPKRFR